MRLKHLILNCSLTCSVALPVAAICYTNTVTRAAVVPPAVAPSFFSDWHLIHNQLEMIQPEALRLEFQNGDGKNVVFVTRRTPQREQIHDIDICTNIRALKSKKLENVQVPAPGRTVNAVLSDVEFPSGNALVLSWFQNHKRTAANRWAWRASEIIHLNEQEPYFDQIVLSTKRSGDLKSDRNFLLNVASRIEL